MYCITLTRLDAGLESPLVGLLVETSLLLRETPIRGEGVDVRPRRAIAVAGTDVDDGF